MSKTTPETEALVDERCDDLDDAEFALSQAATTVACAMFRLACAQRRDGQVKASARTMMRRRAFKRAMVAAGVDPEWGR